MYEEVAGSVRSSQANPQSQKFWLLCAAVSGFVTISTQVAWTRVLTMIIGSSTYAFSLVVALFLLGLAIGAYLVARKKTATNLPRSIMNVELATAVALVLSILMTNASPNLLIELERVWKSIHGSDC